MLSDTKAYNTYNAIFYSPFILLFFLEFDSAELEFRFTSQQKEGLRSNETTYFETNNIITKIQKYYFTSFQQAA